MPVSELVVLGLRITKSKVVVLPTGMFDAPNDLDSVGGPTTVSDAVAVFPVPASEVTVTELFLTPAVVPETVTPWVHPPVGANVPPAKLMDEVERVSVPPQNASETGDDAPGTIKPAGSESVNPMPVSELVVLGLRITKSKVVVLPTGMFDAPNDLDSVGGRGGVGPA
jgi:hypothetical protein